MLLGLNIAVVDEDIVSVMNSLYVKTPEALKRLLKELESVGYRIDDLRKDESREEDGVAIETMEQNGWSLWFAAIPDIRKGKCNSCNSYISVAGIQSHGHKCEVCKEVTYFDIVEGSIAYFEFNNERYRDLFVAPQLKMKTKRWDTQEGYLYLYLEFLKGGKIGVVDSEKAEAYLAENKDLWEIVEENGSKLLKVRHLFDRWDRKHSAIVVTDTYDHHWNHKIVKIWEGKEYREWDPLPVSEMISIYETWHWAPLLASPTLHTDILHAASQVSDQGYYHQDGRPAFHPEKWQEMSNFVHHFTVLDGKAFDLAWPRFRQDGPGAIADLAKFCHDSPRIENRPNIGNTLAVLGKAMEGTTLSQKEVEEAARGAADDPRAKGLFR